MMKLLVCGGRHYADTKLLNATLDVLRPHIALLIHGGSIGADKLAGEWSRTRGVHCAEVRALWDFYDNPAGPLRNRIMLDYLRPDVVLAFPGGNGTAHMTGIARKAGVPVRRPADVFEAFSGDRVAAPERYRKFMEKEA